MTDMTSKIAAMARITKDTDQNGCAVFPSYMREKMHEWDREGLIEIFGVDKAKITDKGRELAKKAMPVRTEV